MEKVVCGQCCYHMETFEEIESSPGFLMKVGRCGVEPSPVERAASFPVCPLYEPKTWED